MSELVDTTSTNEEEKEVAVGSEQLQEGEEKGDDNKKNADYESSDGASASGGENFDENDSIDSITEAVETPDEANNNSKGDMTAESAVTEDENTQEDQKNEVNALPEPVIDGVNFVEVFFGEGSLGVTLRRRANDGIVYVHEILPNSQATELDIEPADQLWRVGDVEVRDNPLDKDSWLNLIHYIKDCPRPMRSVWRRPPPVPESERADIAQDTTPMKSDGCTSGRNSSLKPQDEPISPTGVSSKADVSAEKDLPKQKTEYTVDPLLESTMAKLDFKDRNPKVRKLDSEMYKKYLVPGRRVVKTGVVGIATKASIWSSQAKRVLILLSDLLIISIPSSNDRKTVESIIELPICKINSDGHSFGGGADGVISGDTEFELIWPGGTIRIAADSHETKEVWVLSIFVAICDCVGQDEKVLGWRHQYMLGTMHAAVLSRDEFRVHELISLCESEKLDFSLIESRDMDGYTPLHYACMFRLHPIVLSLQEATADVTSTDVNGLTPLHWAALQLDDYVLSLLLTHVFDADITDEFGRTPLYMAVVEGRDVTGKTDSDELLNCVRCLHERKPNADIRDRRGNTLLHYLAGSWQFNCMEILIEDGANISAVEKETGMTALHRAISGRPLKRAIGEGSIILREGTAYDRKNDFPYVYDNVWKKSTPVEMEELNRPYGAETIKTLLRAGAAPNKKDGRGRTPLAIIAQEDTIDIWDFDLSEAVAALLSFGARLDDSPAISSLKSKCFDINFAALQEKWISTPPVNGDALGIK